VSDETPQGICIFCGTARPVNVAICPTCKRTWIDRRLTETPLAATPPPAPEAAPDATIPVPPEGEALPEPEPIDTISLDELNARLARSGEATPPPPPPEPAIPAAPSPPPPAVAPPAPPGEPSFAAGPSGPGEPPEPPPPVARDRRGWWVALAVAAAVLSLYLIVFVLLLNDGNGEPVAITSTTTTSSTTTPATTTTTSATTTTTSSTTTTTTIPPIDPVGDPIPLTDLELGAFALGPLDLATDSTDALGRLAATLGQPEATAEAGEADGLCPGTTGSTYRWSGLTTIFLDVDGGQALVGYRLAPAPDGAAADTDQLATLSGLRLGQTVGDIRSIYANSRVTIIDHAGTPHFVLQRSSDDRTLLWGPVTSSDDAGIVEGISSPLWCDDGPSPS